MTPFNSSPPEMSRVMAPRWFTILDFFRTCSISASARPHSFIRLIKYSEVFPSRDSFDAPISLASSPLYMFPCFETAALTKPSSTLGGTRTRIATFSRVFRACSLRRLPEDESRVGRGRKEDLLPSDASVSEVSAASRPRGKGEVNSHKMRPEFRLNLGKVEARDV